MNHEDESPKHNKELLTVPFQIPYINDRINAHSLLNASYLIDAQVKLGF